MIVTSLPPRATPARLRVRPPRAAVLALAVLLGALLPAGCGYEQARPGLPAGARSLAIGLVRNATYRGELDVLLHDALRQRLLRAPGVHLTTPARSDLLLVVELTELDVVRARNLDDTNLSSLTFRLKGRMALYDQRGEHRQLTAGPVTAASVLNFARPVIETPSVQDEGLEEVIGVFAAEVEARVFRFF